MEPGRRQRMKEILRLALALAAAGAMLLAGTLWLGRGIPCPLYAVTGLRCPACGMTRAAAALCTGDLPGALAQNLLCIPILAGLALFLGIQGWRYVRRGACPLGRGGQALAWALAAVLALWMILRNKYNL